MFGSSVVTIELQPLLVVTVRARGGRDSAGLLGTYLQKLLSENMSGISFTFFVCQAYIVRFKVLIFLFFLFILISLLKVL